MTNINTLAKRVERLENGKHKPAHNIKISYKFNKWVVNKDGAEFDTLRDAVKHIKSRYSAANVQVNQTDYILSKMQQRPPISQCCIFLTAGAVANHSLKN